jgi:hypothetical protein
MICSHCFVVVCHCPSMNIVYPFSAEISYYLTAIKQANGKSTYSISFVVRRGRSLPQFNCSVVENIDSNCRRCCMAIPSPSCSGRTDSESLADNAPVPSRSSACERTAVRGHGSEIAGARRSITQPHGSSAVYRMRRSR